MRRARYSAFIKYLRNVDLNVTHGPPGTTSTFASGPVLGCGVDRGGESGSSRLDTLPTEWLAAALSHLAAASKGTAGGTRKGPKGGKSTMGSARAPTSV